MLTNKRLPALLMALALCLSLAVPALASEEAVEEAAVPAEEDIAAEPASDEAEPAESPLPETDGPETEPDDASPAEDGTPAAPVLFDYPQPGGAAKRLASVSVTPDNPTEYETAYTESFLYDEQGRLAKIDSSLGSSTEFIYDESGRVTMITDRYGSRSADYPYRYDDAGRLVYQKDRQHNTGVLAYEQREYAYDDYGYLTSVSISSSFEDGPFSGPVTHPVANTITGGHLVYTYSIDYGWGEPEVYSIEFDADGRMLADVQSYQQHYSNFLDTPCFTVCDHIEDHEIGPYLNTECLFYDTAGNIIASVFLGDDYDEPLRSPTTLVQNPDGYLAAAHDNNRGTTYLFTYEDNPLFGGGSHADLTPLVQALKYLVGLGTERPAPEELRALGGGLVEAVITMLEAKSGGETPATPAPAPTATPAPTPAPAAFSVAMITDYGDITDQSFNQTTYEACKAYCEQNGIDFRYYRPASDSDADRVTMIENAIDEGFTVIVMPGFAFAPAIAETAPAYDDVTFIALDVSEFDLTSAGLETIPANLYCAVYQEELSGFMAGYAAVKLGYTKLGFLGGMAVPAVVRYGYGYLQGADTAAAELGVDVSMNYAYGNQFYGDADITAAMDTWYADGIEIVFACGGGIYNSAAEAARKVDGKVIGVDVDQAGIIDGTYGDGMTVTSAMKGLAVTVRSQLTAIQNGTFEGGKIACLGLTSAIPEENYVQLAPSTCFGDGFTKLDYADLVEAMYSGRLTVSNDTEAPAADFASVITVNDQGNIK